ncbi:MAG: hypothetical protein LH628_23380 [Microcoleus sp. CAN_BIN18]|nr:hypothetical protein [Microcoleus sp. CAN_BIN18]
MQLATHYSRRQKAEGRKEEEQQEEEERSRRVCRHEKSITCISKISQRRTLQTAPM